MLVSTNGFPIHSMRRFRRLQRRAAVVLMVTTAAAAIAGCGSKAAATSRPTATPAPPATCSHKPGSTKPVERFCPVGKEE